MADNVNKKLGKGENVGKLIPTLFAPNVFSTDELLHSRHSL